MSDARSRIFARLKAAPPKAAPALPEWQPARYGDARTRQFTAMLEASHAEVHPVTAADWPERLAAILGNRGLRTVLHAPATAAGQALAADWAGRPATPRLIAYDRPIEEIKDRLVHEADAAFTTTLGGIAETGTLILWPTADEPRLMSLLPPLHIALVDEARLHDNLPDAIQDGGWAGKMPTNALLVSGPSKTADIEQTLAYGVHGPKELIVLLIQKE